MNFKYTLSLAALLAVNIDTTEAKSKDIILKEDRELRHPLLQDCEKACIFEDDDNEWCFEQNDPMLRLGTEFD
jgi:hypothetical protein